MVIVLMYRKVPISNSKTRYRQIDIVGRGMGSSIIDGMNLGRPVLINSSVYFAGFTIQNANVLDFNI